MFTCAQHSLVSIGSVSPLFSCWIWELLGMFFLFFFLFGTKYSNRRLCYCFVFVVVNNFCSVFFSNIEKSLLEVDEPRLKVWFSFFVVLVSDLWSEILYARVERSRVLISNDDIISFKKIRFLSNVIDLDKKM